MGRMGVKTPKKHPPVPILTHSVKSNTRNRLNSNSNNKLDKNLQMEKIDMATKYHDIVGMLDTHLI